VRPFASFALLMLVCPAVAAPAPFPRHASALEQNPLYREAEAGVRIAVKELEKAERSGAEISPRNFIALVRIARARAREAAEKYGEVEAALSRASTAQRDLIAMKAGRAWSLGGEHSRALAYFVAVYDRAGSDKLRAEALAETLHSHRSLGQTAEVRRLANQARQLRGWLDETQRERLDNELRWSEKDR
jgi:hypothetical protein